jgi:hypothetical protein
MDTTDFVQRVTGTAGYYCILALGPRKGQRIQKFYKTAAAAVHAAENMDANGSNAYFALGRFQTDDSREAANVLQMGALFLDLDCGPGKDYPDQPAALKALRTFVKAVKLPKPLLVNSGRGIHVYWPLAEPAPVATWLPVATRLAAACKALGLRTDTAVTEDAARVLRVPGTRNHKDDPPKAVVVLLEGDGATPLPLLDGLLSPHAGEVTTSKVAGGGLFGGAKVLEVEESATSAMRKALTANLDASFKKLARRSAEGTGCQQVAAMLADPASVSEPIWRAGLSLAKFCVEKKAIHWVSQGHPEYDYEATEEKAASIKGPYTCKQFLTHNEAGCEGCPLRGKINAPISLGYIETEPPEEEVIVDPTPREKSATSVPGLGVVPKYPFPYFRGKAGGVYVKTLDDDGETSLKMVWNNDLYVVRRLTDPEQGEVVEMRHHLPRDGIRSFVVPLAVVTSKEEFRKALAAQGVAAINKEVDAIMAYTQTWVKELQYTTTADNAHRQFGWVGEFTGFVLGDRLVTKSAIEFNAPSSTTRTLMDHFRPKGTLEGWKAAMDFYNRPGFELHQFVVCAGFGSALMKFMPINAALIHLWSKDSGFGKTTVQHAALTPWGNPSKLILGERDTYNSKMNRADVLHSVPVCMDEVTNMRPADASDLIYQVTGGQQRNRLRADGNSERHRGDPWNLLFVSSGNSSLIDKVALAKAMPKAEAQRVLEIEVGKLFTGTTDKEATDLFSRSLHENYGHAGPIFVQYVMQNQEQVDLLLTTVQRQIDRLAQLGAENRFWSAAAATTITAAVICNHLGLLSYDVKALRTYLIEKVLKTNTVASTELHTGGMACITEYVYANWGRILQIKSTASGAQPNGNGLDSLVVPEQMPRSTDLAGRYETDKKVLYLIIKPLKDWLAEQQLNFNSVFEEIRTKHGGRKLNVKLTRGTPMNLPPASCIQIQMDLEEPAGGET